MSDMELFVLEREDEKYDGYVGQNGMYNQVFNTEKDLLFHSIKRYTDKGYTLKCFDKVQAKEFMSKRPPVQQILEESKEIIIWRYKISSLFGFRQKTPTPIGTKVKITDFDICNTKKGFVGLIIKHGPAKGVYEITSGGLFGETLLEVNKDIDECDDISTMQAQIDKAAKIRDNDVILMTNKEFGILD